MRHPRSGPGGRRFESFRPDPSFQSLTDGWRKNSPPIYPPTLSCLANRRYVHCGHGRQRNRTFQFGKTDSDRSEPAWPPRRSRCQRSRAPSVADGSARGLDQEDRTNEAAKGRSGFGLGFSISKPPARTANACARRKKRRSDLLYLFAKHVLPIVGSQPPREVTLTSLQLLVNKMAGDGYCKSAVGQIRTSLSAVFVAPIRSSPLWRSFRASSIRSCVPSKSSIRRTRISAGLHLSLSLRHVMSALGVLRPLGRTHPNSAAILN
jgi:hypothetical protein